MSTTTGEPPTAVPRRSRRWLFAVLGAFALAAGVGAALLLPKPGGSADSLLAIALPDLDGASQPLSQWRGKMVVVNFWATWCAPCREEMPMFVKAQRDHGRDGLQFVGIAIDDAAKVRQFADEVALNYPALIGGYGALELSRTLGNSMMALPFTVVVDRAGKIRLTQLGPLKPAQLDAIVADLR